MANFPAPIGWYLREGLQANRIVVRRGFSRAHPKDHHGIQFVIWYIHELPRQV